MKLIHTADWHLGDRLGSIDRTEDIRRAVERVVGYCEETDVDVLLVAGDLFSDRCQMDGLRDSLDHLNGVLQPFLAKGGAVIAVTGNHDKESFCRTLWHAMRLAAPTANLGVTLPGGRFYLATGPTFMRLRDRGGQDVQFVLMPYPTDQRYLLDEKQQRYTSVDEKHRALQTAYKNRLEAITNDLRFNQQLPTVLMAHIHVRGGSLSSLFRMTEQEEVIFSENDVPTGWAYVALGHIHKPQCLMGLPSVRYSGSIERLAYDEHADDKSVVAVEIGAHGLIGQPQVLPLSPTSFLNITIDNPAEDLLRFSGEYTHGTNDLVRCRVKYQTGRDDLNAILKDIRTLFPRCYDLSWHDVSDATATKGLAAPPSLANMHDTVIDYLKAQLVEHRDRDEILKLAEQLLLEVEA